MVLNNTKANYYLRGWYSIQSETWSCAPLFLHYPCEIQVFRFHISVPLHSTFRAGGLICNVICGYIIFRRLYSAKQVRWVSPFYSLVPPSQLLCAPIVLSPYHDHYILRRLYPYWWWLLESWSLPSPQLTKKQLRACFQPLRLILDEDCSIPFWHRLSCINHIYDRCFLQQDGSDRFHSSSFFWMDSN